VFWPQSTVTLQRGLKRVGEEYPNPRVKEGRRQLWLIDDLDNAIVRAANPKLWFAGRENPAP
jgi:hypothetical protein